MPILPWSRAFALAALAALSACSGDVNPLRDAAVATGVGLERRKGPDFVEKSRPGQLDYVPVGVSAPPRRTTARTASGVRSAEGEMDAIRAQNEARGAAAREAGATAPPVAPKPPPTAE